MSRRGLLQATVVLCAIAALAIVVAAAHRLSDDKAAAAAQRAEAQRIRKSFVEAAEAAERAGLATTPPEVLKARKDASIREFQAAEAEMLLQQTRARQAREARGTDTVPPARGPEASASRP